jgi:hypothetical protein
LSTNDTGIIDTRRHALELAGSGMHVFPLKPNSKQPATSNGLKDASDDPERVAAMFHPRFDGLEKGIGIACEPSGLLVVDLDGDEGMAQRDKFPPTLTALTGKGAHLYYAGTGKSTVRRLGEGVDTRGIGGYVVAPPSRHPNGHRYRWDDVEVPVAPLSDWIAAALKPRPKAARRRRKNADPATKTVLLWSAVERLRATAEGGRNNALNREVYFARDLMEHQHLAVLFVAEGEALGLELEEVVRTVASALDRTVEEVESWL